VENRRWRSSNASPVQPWKLLESDTRGKKEPRSLVSVNDSLSDAAGAHERIFAESRDKICSNVSRCESIVSMNASRDARLIGRVGDWVDWRIGSNRKVIDGSLDHFQFRSSSHPSLPVALFRSIGQVRRIASPGRESRSREPRGSEYSDHVSRSREDLRALEEETAPVDRW